MFKSVVLAFSVGQELISQFLQVSKWRSTKNNRKKGTSLVARLADLSTQTSKA
jgi:hypothetical protein